MPFDYHHVVRFHETDGAGVVYFANGLVICHSAYEASLTATGISPQTFFRASPLAFPIVHASIDFHRPLRCGDAVTIRLTPIRVGEHSYEIHYRLGWDPVDKPAATALTRHVCIDGDRRQRRPLPPNMERWLTQWGEP
ncbi:1,4-dihydroxy-2-naphthoyl-CoA hydrolase [Halomicronema hongdechloris C2206]|uniref:1,4-dihydroxy-2-naphthoyl-CoA hydrolase n=1 Tax=Halomicronema hongdechloris C2206 TaxID=1641165 RepID=A0A1Z3HV27_9CYAN|nr:thioesterase family protein [Halomicronema hongdechloris]ASC73987.1 1,4-dihydroxy-2-naphthoyl-CoA hydrolase [Halomicronema hongdechloris C2206]